MIGRLQGTLAHKQAPELLVDVQGVGYEVQVSLNTYFGLPAEGQPVTLHTHQVVREDAHQLFGFADHQERSLFRSLIKVSGVGPKMALAILSGMSVSDFVRCIRSDDTATLVRLPGVGKKTAERLVIEMRDRIDAWTGAESGSLEPTPATGVQGSNALEEAESALVALGYKPQEASKMVSAAVAVEGADAGSEPLIRAALKNVVRKK